MKLQLETAGGQNVFTGYGDGYVNVNRTRYEQSLIVLPDRIIDDWQGVTFETLTPSHFEFLATLTPEIVLLGTGAKLRFPHPALTRHLMSARIGLEVMDSRAVCRTYNFLVAEGRKIAAAVLMSSTQ